MSTVDVRTRTADERLETSARASASTRDEPLAPAAVDVEAWAPRTIDRYLIVRRLGAGGMGIVFAAYDERLDRRVAIKVLRARARRPDADRQSQLREAKALARLSHPNVVQIYEVGEVDGEVFLAMEYIEGETLRAWLKRGPPRPREALALLVQCARGLAAIHAAGLVHCDFKPENVLITPDGVARLVDFGLVTRIDDDDRGASGAVIGTPPYMSPEQHRGERPSPASDQFSLCVTIYEALHGARPFHGESREAWLGAIARGLPRATRVGVSPRVHAAIARGCDLDPARRWPSMAALGQALERDRARGRRVAAGALLLALIGLGGFDLAIRSGQRDDACAAGRVQLDATWGDARRREVAQAFAEVPAPLVAETSPRVLAELDRYANAWIRAYEDTCAAQLRGDASAAQLARRMACLERRRVELAALVAVFTDADRGVLERAIAATSDLRPLSRCSDVDVLDGVILRPDDPEVEASVRAVEEALAQAKADQAAGRYQRGLERARAALDLSKETGYPPIEAEALMRVGYLLQHVGEYREATETLARAYWVAEAAHDDWTKIEVATLLVTVEGVHGSGAVDDLRWASHARAAIRRVGGSAEAEGRLLAAEGALAHARGEHAAAVAQLEAALAQLEPALGPGHLDVARVVNNLGAALGALGRHEDAAAAFARVLAIFEAALGGEHPLVAAVQSNLGATADQRGHHEEALAHYQRALAMYERDLGAAHPLVASVLSNMGDTLRALGRLDEAHASLTRALELRRSALADHPRLAYSLTNLAVVELERGELASAREHFGQARAILERSFGERHRSLGPPLVGLGRVALATGECDEAIELLRAALMTDGGDDPLPDEDDPLALIAALWRRVDRREAALALARAQQQRSPAPELAAWLSAHDPERAP